VTLEAVRKKGGGRVGRRGRSGSCQANRCGRPADPLRGKKKKDITCGPLRVAMALDASSPIALVVGCL